MKHNWHILLKPILKQAGDILLSLYNKPLPEHEKLEGGFVTPADIASEEFLIEHLSALLPEAGIWSEEAGKKNSEHAYCWVIDPLDGTTNFGHGLPYFCISVALTHHNIPIVGAVYQPITKEFFYAEQGQGAWCNGKKLTVSEPATLSTALIGIGLSYKHEETLRLIKASSAIIKTAYGIRHFGAIALDLAYVACGKLDGLFFTDLQWWDFAAGILLVQEAHGIVTNFDKKAIQSTDKAAIVGGKLIHNELCSKLFS